MSSAEQVGREKYPALSQRVAFRKGAVYFTVHSCSPAENVGCIVTSSRKAPVVTGVNDTR